MLFHVGDSRLYAIDEHRVQCLTVDHVPATHLAMLGLLNGAQWLQQVHIQTSSQISQAFILGSTLGVPHLYAETIDAELYELHEGNLPLFLRGLGDRRMLALEPGWIYLIASDGLWHLSSPQAFIQRWPALLAQPQRPLEELMDELLEVLAETIRQQRSLPDDNCTVILVRKPSQTQRSPSQPRLPHRGLTLEDPAYPVLVTGPVGDRLHATADLFSGRADPVAGRGSCDLSGSAAGRSGCRGTPGTCLAAADPRRFGDGKQLAGAFRPRLVVRFVRSRHLHRTASPRSDQSRPHRSSGSYPAANAQPDR